MLVKRKLKLGDFRTPGRSTGARAGREGSGRRVAAVTAFDRGLFLADEPMVKSQDGFAKATHSFRSLRVQEVLQSPKSDGRLTGRRGRSFGLKGNT